MSSCRFFNRHCFPPLQSAYPQLYISKQIFLLIQSRARSARKTLPSTLSSVFITQGLLQHIYPPLVCIDTDTQSSLKPLGTIRHGGSFLFWELWANWVMPQRRRAGRETHSVPPVSLVKVRQGTQDAKMTSSTQFIIISSIFCSIPF